MIKGYETKDVKASKTKKADSIIKKEDDGLFYFTFKGDKHGFTTEENAKIALERLSNE
tara:strand:+ start:1066 stop:1239 length:174 start_codon:yes stop_codon:yes gene_type:complete